MKNCQFNVHAAVAHKDFIGTVIALAEGKRGDAAVRRKALELIQQWGVAFAEMTDVLPSYAAAYRTLQAARAPFPDVSTVTPLFTPPATTRSSAVPAAASSSAGGRSGGTGAGRARGAVPSSPVHTQLERLTAEFDKLRRDLQAVRSVITSLANQLLGGAARTLPLYLDNIDFLEQCAPRLMELIEAGSSGELDEETFEACLQVNDAVQRVLGISRRDSTADVRDELEALAAAGDGGGDVGGGDADGEDDGDDLLGVGGGASGATADGHVAPPALEGDLADLFGAGGSASAGATAAGATAAAADPFAEIARRKSAAAAAAAARTAPAPAAAPAAVKTGTTPATARGGAAHMPAGDDPFAAIAARKHSAAGTAAAPAPAPAPAPPAPTAPPAAAGAAAAPAAQPAASDDVDDFESFLSERMATISTTGAGDGSTSATL